MPWEHPISVLYTGFISHILQTLLLQQVNHFHRLLVLHVQGYTLEQCLMCRCTIQVCLRCGIVSMYSCLPVVRVRDRDD